MSRWNRRIVPLAISIVLAACASVPPQAPRVPTAATPPLITSELPASPVPVSINVSVPTTNVWDKLRSSFVMSDCNADPSVVEWATHYTRNSKLFEKNLREALPRLVYVQQIAAQYRIPGEFVLLPWVESHYRPIPAREQHPAGIWQIMPIAARSMGLQTAPHYDARLDMPAATHAVMKQLAQYHDRFHDWRVADYAFSAGEFRLRRLTVEHGTPADEPVIPALPVPRTVREHLVKLLAMACVVREPERFHVSLPVLPAGERLVQTPVTHSMPITRAADLSGMSVAALRRLNPAFGGDRVATRAASYLMLPAGRADQFRAAMDAPSAERAGDISTRMAAASERTAGTRHRHKTHVVTTGESLWQIAREYSTSVTRVEELNQLPEGTAIQPGQVLQLDVVD